MSRKLEDLQCPECKQKNILSFDEVWCGNTIRFDVEESQITSTGYIGDNGAPQKVIALCGSCRHEWVVRGVKQITDIEAPRLCHYLDGNDYE
ncbi:hypothetical protein [Vibrio barjaei]|uniref:hypothetical protein n=1 Tax=Vibrio barjaei TaxID=1676683 RepID=UPI002283F685|nr:hypothetical protein [Vibrio barjaei]MCY9870402.1 hypothetical protein [Vibrio barjaei]